MAQHIIIGPCRIADAYGTNEPGDVVTNPSDSLVALAESGATDPETGLPYATFETPAPAAPAPAAPQPETEDA